MANKLDLADAQFLGWSHSQSGFSLTSLVASMGLTKAEWLKWKSDYIHTILEEHEIKEIDEYFGLKRDNVHKF